MVEGNARNWEPASSKSVVESVAAAEEHGKNCVAGNKKQENKNHTGTRKFKLLKWIFTEAQCGKDELDCHFSYIRRCFERWVAMSEKKLACPRECSMRCHNLLWP